MILFFKMSVFCKCLTERISYLLQGSEDLVIVHNALDYGECRLSIAVGLNLSFLIKWSNIVTNINLKLSIFTFQIPKYGIFENVNSVKELAEMPQWTSDKPLRVATGFTYVINFLLLAIYFTVYSF